VKDNPTADVLSTPKTPRSRKTALHQNSSNNASTAASNQPTKHAERFKRKAVLNMEEAALLDTQVQDAASCHPERPEDLAETIEGLVSSNCKSCSCCTISCSHSISDKIVCRRPPALRKYKLSQPLLSPWDVSLYVTVHNPHWWAFFSPILWADAWVCAAGLFATGLLVVLLAVLTMKWDPIKHWLSS